MNRATRIFSLIFAIILAPLFFNLCHAAAQSSHQDQKAKTPDAAAPAPLDPNSSAQALLAPAADKKRIVVLDFDDTSVGDELLGDKVDVGKEIAGLLETRLAQDGTYIVIDPKTLSADSAEHNFSKNDRYNFEFAMELGKRLGADGVIMGSLTLFGKDRYARPISQDEMIRRKIKARAEAEARVIDVASGEIVAVASGRGESKRDGISLTSGGSNWHDFRSGNFGFASSEFQETILGEAVNDMVARLAAGIAAEAAQLTAATEITGLVVSVSGDGAEIVLNIGAKAGLKAGDHLKVELIVRDIPDPASGSLGKLITTQIGTVRVAQVHDTSAVAAKISGDGGFKVGDHATVVAH